MSSDFFTLRDDYYEDLRQEYGDGDYAMGLSEDAARPDHQRMLAAEEYRRGTPPLTYEEQEALSIAAPAQQGAELKQTMASSVVIPVGLSLLELGLGLGAMYLAGYLLDKLQQPQEQEEHAHSGYYPHGININKEIALLERRLAVLRHE